MDSLGDFSQKTSDDFIPFFILEIMYENYYHKQLAKINTFVEYSINVYHRYILPFCLGNLSSCDYQGDSVNDMFARFPNYFLPFPLVVPHVCPGISTVSFVISPVSWHCFPSFLLQIWWARKVFKDLNKQMMHDTLKCLSRKSFYIKKVFHK